MNSIWLLFVYVILVSTLVQAQVTTPTSPTTIPTPPPVTVGFVASNPQHDDNPSDHNDNDIEWDGHKDLAEDVHLFWKLDDSDDTITIKFVVDQIAWIGLGWNPDADRGEMTNADMAVLSKVGAELELRDMWSTNFVTPVTDRNDDLDDKEFDQRDGTTWFQFTRSLRTNDRQDKSISSGVNFIIWAYGESDEFDYHYHHRGHTLVDFSGDGSASKGSSHDHSISHDQYDDDNNSGSHDQYDDDNNSGSHDQYDDDNHSGSHDQYDDNRSGSHDQYDDDNRSGSHDQYDDDNRSGSHDQYDDDNHSGSHDQYDDDNRSGSHDQYDQYEDEYSGSHDGNHYDNEEYSGDNHDSHQNSNSYQPKYDNGKSYSGYDQTNRKYKQYDYQDPNYEYHSDRRQGDQDEFGSDSESYHSDKGEYHSSNSEYSKYGPYGQNKYGSFQKDFSDYDRQHYGSGRGSGSGSGSGHGYIPSSFGSKGGSRGYSFEEHSSSQMVNGKYSGNSYKNQQEYFVPRRR